MLLSVLLVVLIFPPWANAKPAKRTSQTSKPKSPLKSLNMSNIFHPSVFDWTWYLENYKDLKNSGTIKKENVREHWANYGLSEGRQGCRSFHTLQYKSKNVELNKLLYSMDNLAIINYYLSQSVKDRWRSFQYGNMQYWQYSLTNTMVLNSLFWAKSFNPLRIKHLLSSLDVRILPISATKFNDGCSNTIPAHRSNISQSDMLFHRFLLKQNYSNSK